MPKLSNYTTPTGAKGNLFNIGDWMSLIIGGVVLWFVAATSQNLAKLISGKVPGNFADSSVEFGSGNKQAEQKESKNQRKVV